MTDAEFKQFLRRGGSEIAVIAELTYSKEFGGALATDTLRFSDTEDAVIGSQPYRPLISSAPDVERAIDLERLGGRGARTIGTLTLDNTDGSLSYLLDVIVDGYDAVVSIGGKGWDRADYRMLGKAAVVSVKSAQDAEGAQLVVSMRDKNFLLDDAIVGDTIATGPNAGKPKPILLGSVRNFDITPYLFDTAALKYYINDFPLNAGFDFISAVRDSGVSLATTPLLTVSGATMSANPATETITYIPGVHGLSVNDVVVFRAPGTLPAGLSYNTQYWVIAAGLTAGDFRLSLTKGGAAVNITGTTFTGSGALDRRRFYIDTAAATLELSGSPAGLVTIDIDAEPLTAGYLTSLPHGAFKYVLQNYSKLAPADYDLVAIEALYNAQLIVPLLFGMAILDRRNVVEVLDQIAMATLSWYAWTSGGVLTVGKLDLQNLDAAPAVDAIDADGDIGEDGVSSENLPLRWGKITLDTRRNVTVQSDGLAAGVTADQRSLWVQQSQVRVSTTDPGTTGYLANWWDYHRTAIDSKPVETLLDVGAATAQTVVDEMTALFGPWTRVHRCQVGIDKYALNPGDCVTLTYPRDGLEGGKNCRVVSVKARASDKVCDVVLVRKAVPDYTGATVH